MLVMTAKVDKKKIAIIAAAVVAVIAAIVLLCTRKDSTPTMAPSAVTSNDDRVQFLTNFGWEVVVSPTETSQVRIPSKPTAVFERYNSLQKSQGYDLSEYAGKTVMRYVYKVKNYPGATQPVYATILICNNQVIGGDVTDTAASGYIQGFKFPEKAPEVKK